MQTEQQNETRHENGKDWVAESNKMVEAVEKALHDFPHHLTSDLWKPHREVVKMWARLVQSDSLSPSEVMRFLGILKANRCRATGWEHIAYLGYEWAKTTGFEIPSEDQFYAIPKIYRVLDDRSVPVQEQAQPFVSHFKEQTTIDPDQEIWELGLRVAQEWLRLMEISHLPESDASNLIKTVEANQNKALEWMMMTICIADWLMASSQIHSWSQDFQAKLKKLSSD